MKTLSIFSFLFIVSISSIFAQIPRTINYQGLINDASGKPIPDGNHSLKLGIYVDPSGGLPLYTETQLGVAVTKGLFSIAIGSFAQFPQDVLDFSRQYYLGISVDGSTELPMRTKLTSVPYSMRSVVAEHVAVADRTTVADSLKLPYLCITGDPNTAFEIQNSAKGGNAIFGISRVDGVGVGGSSVSGMGVYAGSQSGTGLAASSNTGDGVVARSNASGNGLTAISETGNAVSAVSTSGVGISGQSTSGTAIYGISTTGVSANFLISNSANSSNTLVVTTNGSGSAIKATSTILTGTVPAIIGQASSTSDSATGIKGEITSTSPGNHSAGVWGINDGTGSRGVGVYGSHAGGGSGVLGISETAIGVFGVSRGAGFGVAGHAFGAGIGVSAEAADGGNAFNASMDGNSASTTIANNCAIFSSATGNGGVGGNVARIDRNGKGYFDGGTQNSGADVAEAFDVLELRSNYEAGDVLVISQKGERLVEKCSTPYSRLVAGVYATKPGVLLTEENIDSDISGKVPMGVIGVIPTKVCAENGPIAIGDLLVTSSKPGYAMKANLKKLQIGQALGKALQSFSGSGTGIIKVLVNVK